MPYGSEPETSGFSGDVVFAAIVLIVAVLTPYLSELNQQRISATLRASVLRPFIATQERLRDTQLRAERIDSLQAQLDTLSGRMATYSALADENETLRALLELEERAGGEYLPASVVRPGTPGSESMFLVELGEADGVVQGSSVVSPTGLVGVIRLARRNSSVGMDWSHPDFRASAMLADGSSYGMVQNRPGGPREEDRLVLNGIAFNEAVDPGALVVTSGLGGVFPRGIPIAAVAEEADAQGSWRRSYWLNPLVEPGSVTHVLVLRKDAPPDVSMVWPRDSIPAGEDSTARGPGR